MHVPLGVRQGNMSFSDDGGGIKGAFEVKGIRATFVGRITESGEAELSGNMTSVFHSFPYTASGNIKNSHLKLDVRGGRYSFYITGEEVGI